MWSPSVGWFSQHLRHMKRRAVCVYPHAPVRELDVEVVGETNSGAVWTRVGSAILGAVVVISAGIAKLFKFQDNWLQFRVVAEGFEREKELHAQKVGDYAINDEEKSNGLLVERVEALLTTTTMQFISIHRTKSAEGKGEEPVGK